MGRCPPGTAIIVGFQSVVEMNLVEIGGYQFFSQFMSFTAQERHLHPGQHGNQRLSDSVRVHARVGIRGFDLAQRARNQKQAMRVLRHLPETCDKDATVGRARVK